MKMRHFCKNRRRPKWPKTEKGRIKVWRWENEIVIYRIDTSVCNKYIVLRGGRSVEENAERERETRETTKWGGQNKNWLVGHHHFSLHSKVSHFCISLTYVCIYLHTRIHFINFVYPNYLVLKVFCFIKFNHY